jgi:hypothetical protein
LFFWRLLLVFATVGGTVFLAREECNMSSKANLTGRSFAFAMTAAGVVAVSAIVASKPSLAQMAPAGSTTSIQHGSEKALKMKQPSFQTREERLKAKPLDWNSTIGKPSPKVSRPPRSKLCEQLGPKRQRAVRRIQRPTKKPASFIRMTGNDTISDS